MRFNIHGRFVLEITRENDGWGVFHLSEGKRRRAHDVVIPPDLQPAEMSVYLDDLFHEIARPDTSIERIDAPNEA